MAGEVRGRVRIVEASDAWQRAVYDFLTRERRSERTFSLLVDVPELVESDPFFGKPPQDWRGAARWVGAVVGYSWRAARGRLREVPAMRWQLSGVTLWRFPPEGVEFGFAPKEED